MKSTSSIQSAIYTDVDVELVDSGKTETLSVCTNRLQAILPFKTASAKLPAIRNQTFSNKNEPAYLR
jgi:hypothetical protein